MSDLFAVIARTMYVEHSALSDELKEVILNSPVLVVTTATTKDDPLNKRVEVVADSGPRQIVLWCPICTALVLNLETHLQKAHDFA